jgi:zinc D-Ala-D-Ala carboxypeptidase
MSLGTAQALPPSRTLAIELLKHANVELADSHVSGVKDSATAKDNLVQTSRGEAAQRSSYQNAPGGTVKLYQLMLWGLLKIADKHRVRVSEVAGGSHSKDSRHYKGVAFDLNLIDRIRVSAANKNFESVKTICKTLGATEVLGPGDKDHDHHIHCAWSLP